MEIRARDRDRKQAQKESAEGQGNGEPILRLKQLRPDWRKESPHFPLLSAQKKLLPLFLCPTPHPIRTCQPDASSWG